MKKTQYYPELFDIFGYAKKSAKLFKVQCPAWYPEEQ
jgi:hypothetical protein